MILFKEMGLEEPLLKAIGEMGFEEPTPIQEQVIPKLLTTGEDIIALAQTGTGKTAAFGLPLIQLADDFPGKVGTLVLCPTRELCIQVTGDLVQFSSHKKGINVVAVYGGASAESQTRSLRKGAQIIVGTPGRVLDLIKRKVLKIKDIQWLVLDEADEMLNMGFKEELDAILEETPDAKQTLLFSATMPGEILRIAERYMREPIEISVGEKNAGAENVSHEFYVTHARNRYETLKRIADMNPSIYGIVFCRTRQETKDVADKFMNDGYNTDALHGELSQAQRDHVMNRFRKKQLQMLVATDVAARGLDVNDLTHVINYNLPNELEAYIHRSGRTGRAGKKGISISIVHTREMKKIKDLEKITRKQFDKKQIPGGREVCKKQLFNLIDKVENIDTEDDQINEFLPEIYKKLGWLSREDLIKHFVTVEFSRFLAYYKNAPDLNAESKPKPKDKGRGEIRRSNGEFSRFFVNLGSVNGLTPPRLIGLVNDATNTRHIEIGKIEIMKKFSFFEIDRQYEGNILKSFRRGLDFSGIPVVVELSKPGHPGSKRKDTLKRRKQKFDKAKNKKGRKRGKFRNP